MLTIVHNEAVFLPIWLRYYSRFFSPDDIYVLDNDTTDGSTDGRGLRPRPGDPATDRHDLDGRDLAGFQRGLLERYDVVLFTDVDEIVAPLPEWGTLGDYLDRLDEEFVNPLGYEILHLPTASRLRPRAPGARSARLLVRQRRLRQAGARDRADDLGRRAFTRAPTAPRTTIRTCA